MKVNWRTGVLGISFLFVGMSPLKVVAHTEAKTNALIKILANSIQGEWGDDVIEDTSSDAEEVFEPVFRTYDDLFADCTETNEFAEIDPNWLGWTPEERKTVFENFLLKIPELSTNAPQNGVLARKGMVEYCGDMFFDFCQRHGQTNALVAATNILAAPHSLCQSSARQIFEAYARPSEATYRFVEGVMTNRTASVMSVGQEYFLMSLGDVLLKHWRETDLTMITNGVKLFHHMTDGCRARNLFDFLMREIDSDYAMSSNRLVFATMALDTPRIPGRFEPYDVRSFFTPITNSLLNASEPLKVLDLSWLDEPPANNENEQQEENND